MRAPDPIAKNTINAGESKNLEEVNDGIFDEFKKTHRIFRWLEIPLRIYTKRRKKS